MTLDLQLRGEYDNWSEPSPRVRVYLGAKEIATLTPVREVALKLHDPDLRRHRERNVVEETVAAYLRSLLGQPVHGTEEDQ